MHLKNLEAEVSESLNSAENLADKLKGEVKAPAPQANAPIAGDIHARLCQIVDMVRSINQQLGRAHSAISG